jgi:hypothetical protein
MLETRSTYLADDDPDITSTNRPYYKVKAGDRSPGQATTGLNTLCIQIKRYVTTSRL